MKNQCDALNLTEDDVVNAMRSMQGYIDITPGTFREIYTQAYDMALKRVRAMGRAEEIMSTPVHCLHTGMTAAEAAGELAELGVSGAPVLDAQERVCGVVSEKDFLRIMGLSDSASFMSVVASCLNTNECMVAELRHMSVEDIMTTPPIVASRITSVAEISEIFIRHAINRIPICDDNVTPVGIVTRTDIVGFMCGR